LAVLRTLRGRFENRVDEPEVLASEVRLAAPLLEEAMAQESPALREAAAVAVGTVMSAVPSLLEKHPGFYQALLSHAEKHCGGDFAYLGWSARDLLRRYGWSPPQPEEEGEEDCRAEAERVADLLERFPDPNAIPVDALGLSVRAANGLAFEGVSQAGDLCKLSMEELLEVRYFNEKVVQEVRERLSEVGLRLRGE
jgi:hypothetical protein